MGEAQTSVELQIYCVISPFGLGIKLTWIFMFSQVSVCPHGGGGGNLGLCPGVSILGGLCPRGSLSRAASVQEGGLCPGGGSLSRRGVSIWGVSVQEGVSVWGVSVHEGSLSRRSLSRGVSVCGSLSWRPPLYGNEQAVRILLECILVVYIFVKHDEHYTLKWTPIWIWICFQDIFLDFTPQLLFQNVSLKVLASTSTWLIRP